MSDQPNEQGGDPMLSPEEDALLDKVWDSIDFDDTEDGAIEEDDAE